MRRRVVGVMGAGDNATPQAIDWASRIGALVAEQGWILLSGGRNAGVMDAVSAGAHRAGGTVVGIMPKSDATEASDFLDIAIVTGMGSARNNINILSSDVIVACGNAEAGTLSEIALAFKARKPVVFLSEDAEATRFLERTGHGLLHPAHTAEQAITLVRKLLDTM